MAEMHRPKRLGVPTREGVCAKGIDVFTSARDYVTDLPRTESLHRNRLVIQHRNPLRLKLFLEMRGYLGVRRGAL